MGAQGSENQSTLCVVRQLASVICTVLVVNSAEMKLATWMNNLREGKCSHLEPSLFAVPRPWWPHCSQGWCSRHAGGRPVLVGGQSSGREPP